MADLNDEKRWLSGARTKVEEARRDARRFEEHYLRVRDDASFNDEDTEWAKHQMMIARQRVRAAREAYKLEEMLYVDRRNSQRKFEQKRAEYHRRMSQASA